MLHEYNKIKKILSDQFQIELFEAAIQNLSEFNNKIRYNNFAYSIRELSRHFLYTLSPEDNVRKCDWFKIETEDGSISRNQRIKYAIQGGFSDKRLVALGFDIEDLESIISDIKKTIQSLNKFTHINAEVFNLDAQIVETNSRLVLDKYLLFVETIESYRECLKEFLEAHIEEIVIEATITNYFENLDTLAPHYSINYCDIISCHLSEINHNTVTVKVLGSVNVTLEYGSNKERREGDGLDINESFPFETNVFYEITDEFPNEKFEMEDFGVDTSSWFAEE